MMDTHCIDCGKEGCSPDCAPTPGVCPKCGSSTGNGRCSDPQGCGFGWEYPSPRSLYPMFGE